MSCPGVMVWDAVGAPRDASPVGSGERTVQVGCSGYTFQPPGRTQPGVGGFVTRG